VFIMRILPCAIYPILIPLETAFGTSPNTLQHGDRLVKLLPQKKSASRPMS
jgi:hypothetical protein